MKLSKENVKQLLRECKNVSDWNTTIGLIKHANGGKIPDWFNKEIVESGLMDEVRKKYPKIETEKKPEKPKDAKEEVVENDSSEEYIEEFADEHTFLTENGNRVYLPDNIVNKYNIEKGKNVSEELLIKILADAYLVLVKKEEEMLQSDLLRKYYGLQPGQTISPEEMKKLASEMTLPNKNNLTDEKSEL